MLAAAAALFARPALAADAPAEFDPYARGTLSIEIENDLFAFSGADRHYTSGGRISWVSAELGE